MKLLENLANNELQDLNQIHGGKRERTGGDGTYVKRDVKKYDRDGDLEWTKVIYYPI